MNDVYIVYPDIGWIPAYQLIDWYIDAVAAGHIQNRHCTTVTEMAVELEDIGFLVRGRPPKEGN